MNHGLIVPWAYCNESYSMILWAILRANPAVLPAIRTDFTDSTELFGRAAGITKQVIAKLVRAEGPGADP